MSAELAAMVPKEIQAELRHDHPVQLSLPVRLSKAVSTTAANISYLLEYLPLPKKRAALIFRLITTVSEHRKKFPQKT